MARPSTGRPSYECSKSRFVAHFNKERIVLVRGEDTDENRKLAQQKYDELVQARAAQVEGDHSEVWAVLNEYLTNARTRTFPDPLSGKTFHQHHRALNDFASMFGRLKVRDLKLRHVEEWLAARKEWHDTKDGKRKTRWGKEYARLNINILKTALRWAAGEGELISVNPFDKKRRVRSPAPDMSLKFLAITEEEHAALLAQADMRKNKNFRDLLRLLYATGARPAEVYMARACEWNRRDSAIEIDPAGPYAEDRLKTRRHLMRKGRKRVIIVPDDLAPLIETLCEQFPEGPLFRTEDGETWTDGKIAGRFRSLCKATASGSAKSVGRPVRQKLTLYSYRHGFVTRWVTEGREVMKLCELLNTSWNMLTRHYSHLFEDRKALREAANSFVKQPGDGPGPHPQTTDGRNAGPVLSVVG